MTSLILGLLAIILFIGIHTYRHGRQRRRSDYINRFDFHPAILSKFREARPNLRQEQEELVFAALRDYFHLCNQAGRRMVSMPSQVVDDAWHAFILYTRGYQRFCHRAFGRFLHHTPAEAMSSPSQAGEGIKRAWRLACAREGIDPREPARLPLLFSIDADLKIEDGFFYVTDCKGHNRAEGGVSAYCGSHVGCASGCGGDSGSTEAVGGGDGGFFSGDSSGCGGD